MSKDIFTVVSVFRGVDTMRALVGICVLLGGCSGDVITRSYADVAAANADDLFDRGWLPDILPNSAKRIRTANNLDLNTSVGSFEISPTDSPSLYGRLQSGAPVGAPFADWEQTVTEFKSQGYSSWTYRYDDSTWAFFCSAANDHCEYLMWLREPGAGV